MTTLFVGSSYTAGTGLDRIGYPMKILEKWDLWSKKKKKYAILAFACAAVLCVAAILVLMARMNRREAQKEPEFLVSEEPEETVPQITEEEETEETESLEEFYERIGLSIPERTIDWEALWEQNKDVYAWISIPDTRVDYPILQHETENNFYVDHNMDGSAGYPGCITSQVQYNGKDFLDFDTILYGHNMRNGSMFSGLHNFEDQEFFEENRWIYIYLPDGTAYAYLIFAAYESSNELIPYTYDFNTEEGRTEYLGTVFSKDNGFYREGIRVSTQNHMLTLSTCTRPSNSKKRYLVQAVLVNDPTMTKELVELTIFSEE